MTKQNYQKPERPKLRHHRPGPPQWLVLEPARIALVGGSFFATLALGVLFVRQWLGTPIGVAQTIIGVGLTGVVGYTATGFFVCFLLRVAERELSAAPDAESSKKPRFSTKEETEEETPAVVPEETAEAEHPEEDTS